MAYLTGRSALSLETRKKIPGPARRFDGRHNVVRHDNQHTGPETDDTLTTEASCQRSVQSAQVTL